MRLRSVWVTVRGGDMSDTIEGVVWTFMVTFACVFLMLSMIA